MKKNTFIQSIFGMLLIPFIITACDNNADTISSPFKDAQELKKTNKDIRADMENEFIDTYENGKINIHIYYKWPQNFVESIYAKCYFTIGVDNGITGETIAGGYDATITDLIYADTNNMIINDISHTFDNVKIPSVDNVGYKISLLTSIWAEYRPGFATGETEVSWYSAFYREHYDENTYSIWYPADELDASLIWIDATIDHYTNLEIVCFNTKDIQDAYAPLLGIDY